MEQVIEFPLDVSKIFFVLQPRAFRRQPKDFTLMLDIDVNIYLLFKYHVLKKQRQQRHYILEDGVWYCALLIAVVGNSTVTASLSASRVGRHDRQGFGCSLFWALPSLLFRFHGHVPHAHHIHLSLFCCQGDNLNNREDRPPQSIGEFELRTCAVKI